MVSFNPPVIHVNMRQIPRNAEATEMHSEGSYQIFTRRVQDKKCGCRADVCEQIQHTCTKWEKRYTNGQLSSYKVYAIKPILKSDEYLENIAYLIEFNAKNKISILGDKNGVQYFNEDGKLIKVCDKFDDDGIGFRTCWEENKWGIWTSSTESWIR